MPTEDKDLDALLVASAVLLAAMDKSLEERRKTAADARLASKAEL